jgi:hypothetical protein
MSNTGKFPFHTYPISAIDDYRRKEAEYLVEQERDVANSILFLCIRLRDELSGLMIGTDGNAIAV